MSQGRVRRFLDIVVICVLGQTIGVWASGTSIVTRSVILQQVLGEGVIRCVWAVMVVLVLMSGVLTSWLGVIVCMWSIQVFRHAAGGMRRG